MVSGQRITERDCSGVLDRYCAASGQRRREYARGNYDTWQAGELTLWNESGVKRLRRYVIGSGGQATAVSDIGPGFATWRELYGFLQGMAEAEYLRREEA